MDKSDEVQIPRKNYKWLKLSPNEINDIKDKFKVLSPQAKEYFDFAPFLSVVLTKYCTLRCEYCGEGGEGTKAQEPFQNIETIKQRLKKALELGIKKIRLTGGEPFLYPKLDELLGYLYELKESYNFFLLVNTNGTLPYLNKYFNILENLEARLVFHLDTIDEATYIQITKGNSRLFNNLLNNISLSKERNLLHRFNSVISKYNVNKFWDLVDYARNIGTNMKIFDITEVPQQYKSKESIYVPLDDLIKKLESKARDKFFHPYAIAFGTPVMIYDIDGVLISVKYTKYGSRYDVTGYCKSCPFFPCDEGLYDILYYPDDKLWACRWRRPKGILNDNFEHDLKELFKVYKRAKWVVGGEIIDDQF